MAEWIKLLQNGSVVVGPDEVLEVFTQSAGSAYPASTQAPSVTYRGSASQALYTASGSDVYFRLQKAGASDAMIRLDKLEGTLKAEVAADVWWKSLTRKEQQAYIKAHPRSKYAKYGVTKKTLQDLHHEEKEQYHRDAASRHFDAAEKAGKKRPGLQKAHFDAYDAHRDAIRAHLKARGRKDPAGSAEADELTKKADAASEAVKSRPVADKNAIHSGTSAIAASNYLVKKFGAKRHANFSSNKYSDDQSLDHNVSGAGAKKMHDHLMANGWKMEESPAKEYYARKESVVGTHRRYTHPDGGHIDYLHKLGAHTNSGKDYHRVTVWGKKKAKPTTIPYYD